MGWGKEHDVIIWGLKKIISDNGQSVFDEPRRARALIADYFPGISTAEKNLLNISCESGIYQIIVHSTSDEDRNVYMKAKCLLIDDYMIAEPAADLTIERIFKACGKDIPKDVAKSGQKETTYVSGDTLGTLSSQKSDRINTLGKSDALEQINLAMAECIKKAERISKEPLTEAQIMKIQSTSSKLTWVKELVEEIALKADNYLVTEYQMRSVLTFFDEINELEREVMMNLPKEINNIVASMQTYSRNTTFYIQTSGSTISCITKACLSYNGKQYVVAQVPHENLNAVFIVSNNTLILDTDTNAVNYLLNYSKKKGLLN